ncbi:MAG: metallophosphoesterase, partial [Burkholderiaceae bacterium]
MIRLLLKLIQALVHLVPERASRSMRVAPLHWLRRVLDGVPSAWKQPAEHGDFLTMTPEALGYHPVSSRVLLIGDSQIHHFAGNPDSTSNFLDPWSEPSTRPALQGLFGDRLMQRLLEEHLGSHAFDAVFFMGDALNTSCEAELQRFDRVVSTLFGPSGRFAHLPLVLLPGNHDGLLYGNFGVKDPVGWLEKPGALRKALRAAFNAQSWEWTCRCADAAARHPAGCVDRNRFLAYCASWLSSTGSPHVPDAASLSMASPGAGWQAWTVQGVNLQWYESSSASGRRWAARYTDPRDPHRSFLLQLVELPAAGERGRGESAPSPRTLALVFDTSNYRWRPRRAGLVGGITRFQQMVASRMVERASERLSPALTGGPATQLIFFGHHNLHALPTRARWLITHLFVAIREAARIMPLPLYVSAHRHRGGWYSQRINEHALSIGQQVRWTDLNVSSIVDWPIAVRDLRLWARPCVPRAVVAESRHLPAASIDDARATSGTEDLERMAIRIGAKDARGQRRNPFRRSVGWRLRSMSIDADRDAYCAEHALLCGCASTLVRLHVVVARILRQRGEGVESLPSLDSALAELRLASRVRAATMFRRWSNGADTWRAAHRRLRLAVVEYRSRLVAVMDRSPEVDALVCRAVVWSALEDRYQQWADHPDVPTIVGERWYREALNLPEPFARLSTVRPRDERVFPSRLVPWVQFAGRPGAAGTRI